MRGQLGINIMKLLQVQEKKLFSFVQQGELKVNLLQIAPLKSGQIYVSWLSFGKSYHPRNSPNEKLFKHVKSY